MASAMASLITGTASSVEVRTQCASRGALSRGQRLPQSANPGIFAIANSGRRLRNGNAASPTSSSSSLSQLGSKWSVGSRNASLSSGRRGDRIRRTGLPSAVCAVSSDDSQVSNGSVVATAVVSRAILVAAMVVQAVVRAAKALGNTLTATPLPNGSTNAEKELVAALKGRLVLAAGPLFFAAISQTPGSVSTPLTVVASGMAKWLELYSGVLMVRVLLSWFPNIPWERQPLQAVRDMCDPYLNLFRNIIPPLFNALDLSPMLAFMVLGVLTSILNTSAR